MKILINGTEHGIYWGLNTIEAFCEKVDMEMTPALTLLIEETGFKGTIVLAKFISCAVDTYAVINDLPVPSIPYQKIIVELDQKGAEYAKPIMDDFYRSYIIGKSVAELLGIVLEETNKTGAKTKKKSASLKS